MTYRAALPLTPSPFDGVLRDGEEIVVATAARRGLVFAPIDLALVPFGLVFAGIASLFAIQAPGAMALFALPHIAIGLYLAIGRFFWDAIRRASATYAVTDRRLLIHERGRFVSVPLAEIGETTLREREDDAGTITLGRPGPAGLPSGRRGSHARRLELAAEARSFHRALGA
ncbi:MAG: hypothetical protein VYE22_32755 [Myxococcota bacterium]|nr:hypothetical protein [Myxococcota bacterium]